MLAFDYCLKKRRKKKAKGKDLFNQVTRLTGIPSRAIKNELHGVLQRKNLNVNDLTLDQLRIAVASYMREIMSGILDLKPAKRAKENS